MAEPVIPPMPPSEEAPQAPQMVHMVDPSGTTVEVAADDANRAVAFGFQPANKAQVEDYERRADLQARFGGGKGAALAFGSSAARALTMGLSDVALTKTGLAESETLKNLEEVQPIASGLGTAAGVVAPALLTGGASAAAKGAATAGEAAAGKGLLSAAAEFSAPSLISKAGRAAEHGVESLLGQGTTLAGQVARKAASMGAGSAVEGAFYGAGDVISESALGDPTLTAESALSQIGLSAALGGGMGAAFGGASVALPAAGRAVKAKAGEAFERVQGALEDALASKSQNPETLKLVFNHKLTLNELEKAAPGVSDAVAASTPQTAQAVIDNAPNIARAESIAPGFAKKVAEAAPGDAEFLAKNVDSLMELKTASKTAFDDVTNATPEMMRYFVENKGKVLEYERAFPGSIKELARADPKTADLLASNYGKIITDAKFSNGMNTRLKDGLASMLDEASNASRSANTDVFSKEARAFLESADGTAARKGFDQIANSIEDRLLKMMERPDLYDSKATNKLASILDGLRKDSGQTQSALGAFERAQVLRKQIDDLRFYDVAQYGAARKDVAVQGVQRELADLRGMVKAYQTSEEIFGQAAARKAAIDSAQHEFLGHVGKDGDFALRFLNKGKVSINKVNSAINTAADGRGGEAFGNIGDMLSAARKYADVIEGSGGDVASLRGAIDAAESTAKDIQERVTITNIKRAYDPRIPWGRGPIVGGSAGLVPPSGMSPEQFQGIVNRAAEAASGKASGSAADAAAKATAEAFAKASADAAEKTSGAIGELGKTLAGLVVPHSAMSAFEGAVEVTRSATAAVTKLSALEKMAQATSKAIDVGASMVVKASDMAYRVGRGEVSAGLSSSFSKTAEEASKSFTKRREEINKLAQNPDLMHERLTKMGDGLHEHAPQTTTAIQTASTRAVAFLASKIPHSGQAGPLGPKIEPPPSEVAKFNRYYEAVENPTAILKQAAAGTLTPEAVEAVRVVYPQLYSKMQAAVFDKLTSPGVNLGIQQKQMLQLLMGANLDGFGSPKMMAANQATFAAAPSKSQDKPQGNASSVRLTVANRILTPSQASSQRE